MPSSSPHAGPAADDNVVFLPGVREADEKRAENVSLHALTRRGMSRAEVVDLLIRREIDPIVVQAEVERLEGVGLIDDDALALTLVERLVERKRLGGSALRSELSRRRLSAQSIEAALATLEPDDGGDLVRGLVDDRLRRMGSLDRETAERRLLSYLARKGHGGSDAREAVRAALDEAGLERAPRTGFGSSRGGSGGSGFGSGGSGSTGGFGSRGSSSRFGSRGSGLSRGRGGASAEAGDGPRRVEFE
jgi:regulatory protein